MRFAWSNSAIVARFKGTEATLKLRDFAQGADGDGAPYQNHFTVIVDGVEKDRLTVPAGEGTYAVAKGLSQGVHEVRIVRNTEALVGESEFVSFDFGNGGALLPPAAAPARRIELVGDSITCGYGNEGVGPELPVQPCHEQWLPGLRSPGGPRPGCGRDDPLLVRPGDFPQQRLLHRRNDGRPL